MTDIPQHPSPPDWVSSDATPVNGLDLLGLRTPAMRIGGTLLSAVTTIAPTVRYVSLRAWIARQYAVARMPGSWEAFRAFAGKVEAAVAIGNLLVDERATGLVGRDKVLEHVSNLGEIVELQPVVKQLAVTAYTGPSDALKVSAGTEKDVPVLTLEIGVPLAAAVHETLTTTEFARQLVSDPSRSRYTRASLLELGKAFPIAHPTGKERELLAQCVVGAQGADSGEHGGHTTFRVLLELARKLQRAPKEQDLFQLAIAEPTSLSQKYSNCIDGWAWYLVRDAIAVCHEAALQAVVETLIARGEGLHHSEKVLRDLVIDDSQLEAGLQEFELNDGSISILDQPIAELAKRIHIATSPKIPGTPARWTGNLQEPALALAALAGGRSCLALLPILWLVVRERLMDAAPEEIASLSYQGPWRLGAEQIILPEIEGMLRSGRTVREAIFDLTARSVFQHLTIAWSRLRSDPRRDVAVIATEGDGWYKRKQFAAGRTASRISQAVGWLEQLGLINQSGCTQEGVQLLDKTCSQTSKAVAAL